MDRRTSALRLKPIGVVHSPFRQAAGMPIQPALAGDEEASVELFQEFAPGLKDLEGFERIWLLYWFHRAEWRGELLVIPYLDSTPRGVFSTRAPARPNPLGLSCVRLLAVERNILRFQGVDLLDGTPVLDIKPYVPRFDCFEGARAGWLDAAKKSAVSEGRFARKR